MSSKPEKLFDADNSRRLRERLPLSLPVRVRCRESLEREWVEYSRLIDVTPFGARFTTAHANEVGRLLHLSLPMPRPLRCYDHAEEQYRTWAIVRSVKTIKPPAKATLSSAVRYEIGVAFIGNRKPASYDLDPTTRYEVAAQGETGMWRLTEIKQPSRAAVVPRDETRHQMAYDVLIEVADVDGNVEACEETVTEDISRRGAAVFTTLKLERGRFVRLTDRARNISIVAVVRACRTGSNGIRRLHLEFVDNQFPID